eukprot:TRINITY_DN7915_c0_g1_i1.p1 TRINITY_DN7915_c0_g1~~TRINITY_DN7915_c0_g1_i1.p1  ORF type:complete len:305 (-),score=61.34 TRINITY_DN7915_c0_g1_i1:81-995(-)
MSGVSVSPRVVAAMADRLRSATSFLRVLPELAALTESRLPPALFGSCLTRIDDSLLSCSALATLLQPPLIQLDRLPAHSDEQRTYTRKQLAQLVLLLLTGAVKPHGRGQAWHCRLDLLQLTASKGEPQLQALLYYLQTVTSCDSWNGEEIVSVRRKSLETAENAPDLFANNQNQLINVELEEKKSMEDVISPTIVDFSHDLIGGGVFAGVRAQEELLCCSRPELLVVAVICERMDTRETIAIENVVQYARFEGYGRTLRCVARVRAGDAVQVVAMDASVATHNKIGSICRRHSRARRDESVLCV